MIATDSLVAGRYRLRSQIGGGGMGAVWLAHDEQLGREVALKQVLISPHVDAATAAEQRARALREGRIAARLSHPHTIAIYDVAEEAGEPWLVMEYLPSRSLAAVLADAGLLRAEQVAQIGAQLADALAAVHAAGIVHRDVKPANVLIGQGDRIEGLVKITDFGISHATGDVTLTQTGMITGTPAYLAPEVARGIEPGPAADVFALGATLYTCLEGQPPFGRGDNALEQLHRVAAGAIEPPQRAGALTNPLLRMLAADPGDRPTMVQVRNELASLAAGRDGDTTAVLAVPTDLTSDPTADLTPSAPLPAAGAAARTSRSDPNNSTSSSPERPAGLVVWSAVAVAVAVLLVGLASMWVVGRGDDPDGDGATRAGGPVTTDDVVAADQEAPSASVAAPTDVDPTEAAPADEAPVTTTDPDAGDDDEDDGSGDDQGRGAGSIKQFLADFHGSVTDDPAAAYELAGPTLRGAISRADFERFWSAFDEVRVSKVKVADDGRAVADVELVYGDGTVQVERHRYGFVEQDGRRLLDTDEFLEVVSARG